MRAVVDAGSTYSEVVLFGFDQLPRDAKRAAKELCDGYPAVFGSRLWVTVPAPRARGLADELESIARESIVEEKADKRLDSQPVTALRSPTNGAG